MPLKGQKYEKNIDGIINGSIDFFAFRLRKG
jgi:hypothetical protein